MRRNQIIFYMIAIISMLVCFVSGLWLGNKQVQAQNETCISYEITSCVSQGGAYDCTPICGTPDYVWTDKVFSGTTKIYGALDGAVYTAICMGPFKDGQP